MSEIQRYAGGAAKRLAEIRRLKVFYASSVYLSWVPNEYLSSNGCAQFCVLIKAKSKVQAAEIIGQSVRVLNRMGFREFDRHHSFYSIPEKPYVIYYHVEHTKTGFVNKWLAEPPHRYANRIL